MRPGPIEGDEHETEARGHFPAPVIVDHAKAAQMFAALGQEVRRQRHARQMSLRDLAEVAGVSRSYIDELEKGSVQATGFLNLMSLTKALGMSFESIAVAFEKNVFQTPKPSQHLAGPTMG